LIDGWHTPVKKAAAKAYVPATKKSAQSREPLLTPLMRRARNIGTNFCVAKIFFRAFSEGNAIPRALLKLVILSGAKRSRRIGTESNSTRFLEKLGMTEKSTAGHF
jgi:hypothetical protein